jgi:flagellar assembly protein FliH
MGLIKSGKLPTAISPFSLRDVENEARAILARARHQAEQLLAAAQGEGERLKKESHALGLVEGRREGNAAGLEAGRTAGRNEALAAQNQALRQVLAALTASVAALEAQRGSLQVAISRRVTKRQGLIEPEVLAANLSELMSFVAHAADIRIALHPTQNQTLQNVLPQLQVRWPNLKHVELVEDPSIAPGGCRVYTQQGFVDADLDAQINRIVDDLLPRPAEASA